MPAAGRRPSTYRGTGVSTGRLADQTPHAYLYRLGTARGSMAVVCGAGRRVWACPSALPALMAAGSCGAAGDGGPALGGGPLASSPYHRAAPLLPPGGCGPDVHADQSLTTDSAT